MVNRKHSDMNCYVCPLGNIDDMIWDQCTVVVNYEENSSVKQKCATHRKQYLGLSVSKEATNPHATTCTIAQHSTTGKTNEYIY